MTTLNDPVPTLDDLLVQAMRVLDEALIHANYSPYPDIRIQTAQFIVEQVRVREENDRRYAQLVRELDQRDTSLDLERSKIEQKPQE